MEVKCFFCFFCSHCCVIQTQTHQQTLKLLGCSAKTSVNTTEECVRLLSRVGLLINHIIYGIDLPMAVIKMNLIE